MANNVTAPKRQAPTATPERQALADEIAVRVASDRDFAALEAATGWNGHCRQAVSRSPDDRRSTIGNTSEAIKETVRKAAVNTALGNDTPPEVSIEATQAAAQSALDAALVDQEAVEARLKEDAAGRGWNLSRGADTHRMSFIPCQAP
jgi:hypothetical protein